jgi:type IV pilus assembly protein PilP
VSGLSSMTRAPATHAGRARTPGVAAIAAALLAGLLTAGCSGGQSDLEKWITETKQKPGGRIEALPEVKPYETYVYNVSTLRSPFQPQGPNAGSGQASLRPSSRRNREFLEGFSLDTLKMVGTLKVGSNFFGLVQSKDGLVHKVQPGNYLGTNDGKITEITGGKISVVEIIPDGLGGYIERPASLALTD